MASHLLKVVGAGPTLPVVLGTQARQQTRRRGNNKGQDAQGAVHDLAGHDSLRGGHASAWAS